MPNSPTILNNYCPVGELSKKYMLVHKVCSNVNYIGLLQLQIVNLKN